ncbi:MAG TPA: rod shape-determining protein MreD [Bacteroidetes bacterium]|nr:rod shape-determining protein MreD [Bacteroidota bacterium]
MKILNYLLIFFALLILQIRIIPFLSIGKLLPDVLLIGIVVLGVREGGVAAMITALFVGLMKDAFTTSWIGASMLGLVAAGFLAGLYRHARYRMGVQGKLLFLFMIMFVYNLIYYFLYLIDTRLSVVDLVVQFAIPAAIYTFILAGIAHFLAPRGLLGDES